MAVWCFRPPENVKLGSNATCTQQCCVLLHGALEYLHCYTLRPFAQSVACYCVLFC